MRSEMIVLRSKTPVHSRRGLELPGFEARAAGESLPDVSELSVELEELTLREQHDLDRDETVIGRAPPMPVHLIEALATASPGSQAPAVSWGLEAVGATTSARTGAGVTVAVLDTGIDATHPAFQGVTLTTRNFTSEAPEDLHGHGTHCAGTIFGRDVDGSRIGIARGVTKAVIGKVLGADGGSTDAIYKAMLWAAQEGAHVVSMSLGMDFPGFHQRLMQEFGLEAAPATSMALAGYRANVRLFDRISEMMSGVDNPVAGSVVVAAAGNESKRPQYTITVSPPAAGELFLSVAALAQSGDAEKPFAIAEFSNDEANIAAPGVDIWSAKNGGGLVSSSGTSMAAPHVAGVAALWAEVLVEQNEFSSDQVLRAIRRNTLPLPYLDEQDVGEGLVRAP